MTSGHRNKRRAAHTPVLEDYLETIGLIYDAAYDLERWPKAMASIAGMLNAHRALMFAPKVGEQGLWASHDVSTEMMRGYGEYYHQADVWSQRSYRILTHAGATIQNDMAMSDQEYARSEFWTDFARPADIFRVACVAVDLPKQGPAMRTHLSVFRPRASDQFRPEARDFLSRMQPHVLRSLKLGRLLASRSSEILYLQEMLSRVSKALVAVTSDARIVYANAAAEAILSQNNGLTARGTRLVATSHSDTARVTRAIADTAGSGCGGSRAGKGIRLPRPLTSDELTLEIVPLPGEQSRPFAAGGAKAVIVINAPRTLDTTRFARFAEAHRLTQAEFKLVRTLLEGGDLHQAADRLGIKHSTARTQLKSVFLKTGAHRQADLVRLVHALAD